MATILVVDDEQEIASAVRSILEDEGYQVEVCGDGREALDWLGKGALPDLVLTDIMMPRLSGLELVEQLRQEEATAKLPIVLMSAVRPTATRRDAKWNDFLKKPFSLDALLGSVHRQLK